MDVPRGKILGCLNKVPYATFDLALAVARRCSRDRGKPIRVYECMNAKHFHLTSRPRFTTALCGSCLTPFEPEVQEAWQCRPCKEKS